MIPTSSLRTIPARRGRSVPSGIPRVAPARKTFSVLVVASYVWLAVIVLLAVTAPVLPLPAYDVVVGPPRQPPGLGSVPELLGTDGSGRSLLVRVIYGAQVSLVVGTVAGVTGAVVGAALGMIAGYFRGVADWIITLVADVLLSFPVLVLLLAITAILSPSVPVLVAGLALSSAPTFIRLARASTMSWANREFVRAARNMGASSGRILVREILPNVAPALAAYLPLIIAALIVAEGSLSFLGLGIPPPTPSWGGLVNEGAAQLRTTPYMVFVPATVLFLTVFALNQAGEHLRGRFDRTQQD
ncbi:ABC transporter permease [Rathayibacter sp. VKM Ac-2835]|uniref:ABC transporter permease n=1 Tax=Rathayibacter sp. VKM Ac-2835 TaxID=2739043 RepID=UPI00156727A7|nr:ABC transporter permease [Rathayibacter sp. VKM Ac-2835]NRG41051.1 ABC transporter permease [Rathayibacter sp. VKM Ac-2835]